MTQVLYAQNAQTDLLAAWLFVAETNLTAEDRLLEKLEQQAAANRPPASVLHIRDSAQSTVNRSDSTPRLLDKHQRPV
jgi:hypothetical protein